MSRWKALPEELDPRVRQLLVRLRRLKDHSGLNLRQLAAKTGYSPKSWERYLGGRSLPPREAVEAMARLGGDDPARLLALHEVAAEAWQEKRAAVSAAGSAAGSAAVSAAGSAAPSATDPVTDPVTDPQVPDFGLPSAGTERPRSHGRALRIAVVAGVVTLVLAVCSAFLVVVRLSDDDGGPSAEPLVSSAELPKSSPTQSRPTYTCRNKRDDGRWYSGNSLTQDAILTNGLAGPDVAEAQCLLRRAGFSPGAVDGIYGPLTEHAVKSLQKRNHLVVDGIIGPHTWKVLRG